MRVVKKDGRAERFDRNKLLAGCLRACEKRPITRERLDTLVHEIEAVLRSRDMADIPARAIGSLVMERLQQLDSVACMRFASVYQEFETLDSFETELKRLKEVR